MADELAGRRLLILGASSGIGREIARASLRLGARAALSARRSERLAEVIGASDRGLAVPGDIRLEAECRRIVAEAAEWLGGIDALVYAPGIIRLAPIASADAAHWRAVLETNFLGAVHVTRFALSHLRPKALTVFLSSDSVGRPRQGLAAYSASKAALDESILSWRGEHPEQRFLRVVIGPTIGTEAGDGFDPELAARLLPLWVERGTMTREHLEAAELGDLLADVIAVALAHPQISMEDLRLEPTGPLLGGGGGPPAPGEGG